MFTDADRQHVTMQLMARSADDLKNEHLFAKIGDVWHLVKVGNEEFVDGSMIEGAEAYLHTHPIPSHEPLVPSMLDMQMFASSNKPQGIMNFCSHSDVVKPTFWHSSIQPTEESLLGRSYRWGDYGSDGKGDCFSIINDWYKLNKGYEFPIIPRDFYDKNGYYYTLNHQGLCEVKALDSPLEIGDLIVIRLGRHGEHAGVYVGNSVMLHHPMNGVSRLTPVHASMERLHMLLKVTM